MRKKFYQFSINGPVVSLEYVKQYRILVAPQDMRYKLEFQFDDGPEFKSLGDKEWNLESYLADRAILRKLFRVVISDNFLEKEREEAEKCDKWISNRKAELERKENARRDAERLAKERPRRNIVDHSDNDYDYRFFDRLRGTGTCDTGPR